MACSDNENCPGRQSKKVLYGPDGLGGLITCVKGKLSTRAVVYTFVALISLFTWASGRLLDVHAIDKADISANTKAVTVIQTELKAIKATIEEIRAEQKIISQKFIDKRTMKGLMKETWKEIKNDASD